MWLSRDEAESLEIRVSGINIEASLLKVKKSKPDRKFNGFF